MKNLLDKNLTRRNFLQASAKFLLGCSVLNFAPKIASAEVENKIPLPKFKTLDEMKINKVNLRFAKMNLREYTGALVIHHSGLSIDKESTVAGIHEMHIVKNHWAGIGYHFVIHKDGSVETARPLEYRGAHSLNNNDFTVGICLTGNYDLVKPPTPQLTSAIQLIGALCEKYKFQPNDATIFGHRELCKTSCPGENLFPLLPEMIQGTQKILHLI